MKSTLRNTIIIIATMIVLALIAVPAMAAEEAPKAAPVTVQAVAKKAAAIKMNKSTVSVYVGKTTTLKVSNAGSNKVTWKSSNNAVATVNANGVVTAKKAGTVTITATAGGKKTTCKVTVKAIALKSIKLNKSSFTLYTGKSTVAKVTYNPTNTTVNKKVSWKSSNTAVATVDASGRITAKKAGKVTITATCNGKKATATVTVKAHVTSVKLNHTKETLKVGKSVVLSATYAPTSITEDIEWTSSNAAVATVNDDGKITAKKTGSATITATVENKKATCTVTVVNGSETLVTPAGAEWVNTNTCYTMLNSYRKQAGVANLQKDATLEKYAKIRATELIKSFSHTRPSGTAGMSIIPGNIYKGENIAMGQTTCLQVMKEWNASAGHRKNMIKTNYTKVGIAGIEYNGMFYWVQLFSS